MYMHVCTHINTHIPAVMLHCHILHVYIQTYRSIVRAVKAKIRL